MWKKSGIVFCAENTQTYYWQWDDGMVGWVPPEAWSNVWNVRRITAREKRCTVWRYDHPDLDWGGSFFVRHQIPEFENLIIPFQPIDLSKWEIMMATGDWKRINFISGGYKIGNLGETAREMAIIVNTVKHLRQSWPHTWSTTRDTAVAGRRQWASGPPMGAPPTEPTACSLLDCSLNLVWRTPLPTSFVH